MFEDDDKEFTLSPPNTEKISKIKTVSGEDMDKNINITENIEDYKGMASTVIQNLRVIEQSEDRIVNFQLYEMNVKEPHHIINTPIPILRSSLFTETRKTFFNRYKWKIIGIILVLLYIVITTIGAIDLILHDK